MEDEQVEYYEQLLEEREEILPKRKDSNAKYERIRLELLEHFWVWSAHEYEVLQVTVIERMLLSKGLELRQDLHRQGCKDFWIFVLCRTVTSFEETCDLCTKNRCSLHRGEISTFDHGVHCVEHVDESVCEIGS